MTARGTALSARTLASTIVVSLVSFLVLSGGGSSGPVAAIVGAWATATHGVRVSLNQEPMHTDVFGTGDALNPLTWEVTRLDTGAPVTVIGASMVDNQTVDLVLIEPLAHHLVAHSVAAPSLKSHGGSPIGAGGAGFPGVVTTLDPVDAVTVGAFRDRDIANPPFQVDRNLGFAGTIKIGVDGDYDTEAGAPLLRKLLLRRLGTRKNAFRHLRGYGVGLEDKEPIASGGDLAAVRVDIEAQARQEPEVTDARARLSVDRAGVLFVQLQVKVRGGVSLNLRMGSRSGRLVEV